MCKKNVSRYRSIFGKRICDRWRCSGLCQPNFPSIQILRNTSQLSNQSLTLNALTQVNRSNGCPISREFTIQVGHHFFLFNRMHDLVHMASPSARLSFTLSATPLVAVASALLRSGSRCSFSAIRDRNSRERTVFTGSFINSAISA